MSCNCPYPDVGRGSLSLSGWPTFNTLAVDFLETLAETRRRRVVIAEGKSHATALRRNGDREEVSRRSQDDMAHAEQLSGPRQGSGWGCLPAAELAVLRRLAGSECCRRRLVRGGGLAAAGRVGRRRSG